MQHRIPRVHVPVLQPADVIPHLGKPGHFKEGRSGRLVAETWFAHNGPSPAIQAVLSQSDRPAHCEFLDAFLERKIELGDGRQPSQADVLALMGLPGGLAVMAVEGKVEEPFGLFMSEWIEGASAEKERRLARLRSALGLQDAAVGHIRYQFFHRAASAVYEAHRYRASVAVMMVQSFDPESAGLASFQAFAAAMGMHVTDAGHLAGPVACDGVELHLGWASQLVS